jgi:hypothetical protein
MTHAQMGTVFERASGKPDLYVLRVASTSKTPPAAAQVSATCLHVVEEGIRMFATASRQHAGIDVWTKDTLKKKLTSSGAQC